VVRSPLWESGRSQAADRLKRAKIGRTVGTYQEFPERSFAAAFSRQQKKTGRLKAHDRDVSMF
jgi:hypothetical protein